MHGILCAIVEINPLLADTRRVLFSTIAQKTMNYPIRTFLFAARCKVFISPPIVVCPGGVNHNSFIVGINPPGAYHNDCAL